MRKTCLNCVLELAKNHSEVLFLGSDLGAGTMKEFRKTFPERFFMEGVSEQHLIGMAAGLAMEGFIPYVNTIASFLTRRCLEQVTIDLCLPNLPVRLIGNGGGIVYAPLGATHFALDDLALMRLQPNMTVIAPSDAVQMRAFMEISLSHPGPIYIRLAKGGDPVTHPKGLPFVIGQAIELAQGTHIAFLCTGAMAHPALIAAQQLTNKGISCSVWHFPTVKPLDQAALAPIADRHTLLVSLEEHTIVGGFGSAIAEWLMDHHPHPPRLLRLGFPDRFPSHYGSQEQHLAAVGLEPEAIARTVIQSYQRQK
ncbi:MAG: transketolase [Magnetococcales bacterium]|nr:transketolase [Magnetococcales bacterium]